VEAKTSKGDLSPVGQMTALTPLLFWKDVGSKEFKSSDHTFECPTLVAFDDVREVINAHSEHKGMKCVTTLEIESMRKWVLFILDYHSTLSK